MYVPGDEWAGIAQRGAEELHPKQAGWRLSSWRMTSSQPASGRGTQLPNWLAAERCRSAFLAPPSERNVSMLWTLASRYRSRARAKRAGGERLLILTARADAVTMGSVRVGMPVREIPAGAMRVHHLPAPWQQQREEEESARRMGSGGNGRGVRAWVSERCGDGRGG